MKNKVAIVTGAAAGIGKATAIALARRGAQVVISDIDEKGLEDVAAAADEFEAATLFPIRADVASPEDIQNLVAKTVDEFGRLDIAVNNAGIEGARKSTVDYNIEEWDQVMNINLRGQWLCMKHQIPAMLKNGGGSIVNISSILGRVGFAEAPAYTAAKHGLIGLTKAAALEYASQGVRINAVCPGFIITPMLERAGITSDEETRKQVTALHPIGRMGESREVAEAIVWLASDEASFIIGDSLMVDGGYIAR